MRTLLTRSAILRLSFGRRNCPPRQDPFSRDRTRTVRSFQIDDRNVRSSQFAGLRMEMRPRHGTRSFVAGSSVAATAYEPECSSSTLVLAS